MLNLLRFRAMADYSATPELAPQSPMHPNRQLRVKRPIVYTWSTPFRTWNDREGKSSSLVVEANS
jgi:hypothetical protein